MELYLEFIHLDKLHNKTAQIKNAFDPKKNGVADAFDPKKNGVADAFDPKKNGVADAFDPKKNGIGDAFSGLGGGGGARTKTPTGGDYTIYIIIGAVLVGMYAFLPNKKRVYNKF